MSQKRQWRVHINKSLLKWIRGCPPKVFDAYVQAVEGVIEIKDTFNKHGVASCAEGFLVPVPGQEVALRCIIRGHEKEIHIIGTKSLK